MLGKRRALVAARPLPDRVWASQDGSDGPARTTRSRRLVIPARGYDCDCLRYYHDREAVAYLTTCPIYICSENRCRVFAIFACGLPGRQSKGVWVSLWRVAVYVMVLVLTCGFS